MPANLPPLRLPAALLAIVLAGLTAAAHAERADRNAPMHVEADALRYDEARQTSVFTGRVVITKGTIRIRGQRVEVRQNEQGQQFGIALGDASQRAFYRQKRDGLDEYIEGEADRIEYDGQADRVTFRGAAELRRYRGTVLNDRASGAVIVYDNRNETFTVDGDRGRPTADNPSGRVRALLTP
ncbi:MAG: lipopolysaccharide transport periplasmic protein LptA, partial [Tepidimonas sp.]|uniref:lipopolysaccharide transport periplasmic protein LptA n=1 Tax=Tepidimonas sp. TaxID=2002775 RepID=UPI004054BF9E